MRICTSRTKRPPAARTEEAGRCTRACAGRTSAHRSETRICSVCRPVPWPRGCSSPRPSAASHWGRRSDVGCASGKISAGCNGKARGRFAFYACEWLRRVHLAWLLLLRLPASIACALRAQCCCRCCPLRSCTGGGALAGGARGVRTYLIAKSALAGRRTAGSPRSMRRSNHPVAGATPGQGYPRAVAAGRSLANKRADRAERQARRARGLVPVERDDQPWQSWPCSRESLRPPCASAAVSAASLRPSCDTRLACAQSRACCRRQDR
jgi:hypothetical protein